MITMEDGTKIKTGMAFQTKTDGRKAFMVARVHRNGTVSYAPEKAFSRTGGYHQKFEAPATLTVTVTEEEFKALFKKVVEDKFTRDARKAEKEAGIRRAVEARNPDHARALWMDLLVRASRGEDTEVLFDELEGKLKELNEEFDLKLETRLEEKEEEVDGYYGRWS